jgi:cytoskeleton protein RodZ
MTVERPAVDVGRKLRLAREQRGLSLRQIAASTKISSIALEALERNDIARLPGGIFSRAFVRAFAQEVGLDPEATLQEFIAQFPQQSVIAGHPTSDRIEDGEALESERQTASTFLKLAALSVPIAGAVLYLAAVGRPAAPSAPGPTPTRSAPQAASSGPLTADPVASRRAGEDPAATTGATPAALFTVEITATGPCWISAVADGRRAVEQLLQAGEMHRFDVRHELILTAGDAGALAMKINGADARSLGRAGEVVTARLNPNNLEAFLASR